MTDYSLMNKQLLSLTEGVEDGISNLANASALLFHTLEGLNWAGFYLYKNGVLLLGPFQGKTACTKIPMGKGVCGTAAERGETIVVPDVHAFPGHIACDGDSNSEIVIPLYLRGSLYGVLDIDSPLL
ncbi:MAG: GAF domain-containing protein, partial [Clostridia bacterium]|nr:GAF domain-containing protein [Clostridia bacterium]